jgi:hypothetical protein
MTMSLEDQLRTELREEASDFEPSTGYVATTVETVLARRRRRQVSAVATAAAAASILALGGVAIASQTDDGATPPAVEPTEPTPSEPIRTAPPVELAEVQRVPRELRDWDALPWRDTTLPRVLPVDVASAPALSQDPVDHALALVAGPRATVGVVGEDGRLRRLDGVALERTEDPDGYHSNPVSPGSLTSDGRLAALPQRDAVVVVDLANGFSERFEVPGFNTWVQWHPDQRHVLVGRENGTSSDLDLADGSIDDVPYNAYDTTFTQDGNAVQVKVDSAAPAQPVTLIRWDGHTARDRIALSVCCAVGEAPIDATEDRVVVGAVVTDLSDPDDWRQNPGDAWLVLDLDTGDPVAALDIPQAWYRSWVFGLSGWLDADTVLLSTDDGLIAWTPSTGALERVTEGPTEGISLALPAIE